MHWSKDINKVKKEVMFKWTHRQNLLFKRSTDQTGQEKGCIKIMPSYVYVLKL